MANIVIGKKILTLITSSCFLYLKRSNYIKSKMPAIIIGMSTVL
jgi:hypothetical protein